MIKYKNKKSQAVLEYAAVIVIVAAVLVSMSGYIKRTLQERYKQAGDVYGDGFIYSPSETSRNKDIDK